ncbi:site-2 protease family protein [Amphibacillus jilinensis]|uniref:site-2 protease family protein n=1 Tax=Amphibacillus jilinensis TaxID=1216008 RepID=UPI00030BC8A1|nr:site-2 protease family protein [Amphibacillus jilinensis]
MNKLLKYIILFFFSAGIGFLLGYLGNTVDIPPVLTILPWYVQVIIFVLTYIIAVGVHELGHAFSFSKNGVNIRAIFITFFFFVKEDQRWKLKLRPNVATIIGGIVIPDIEAVKTDSTFSKLQQALAKAILTGPIFTLLWWLFLSCAGGVFMLISSNPLIISFWLTIVISLTFITAFLLITCLFKNEIAIGDFPAYKLAKHDRFFTAIQLYQYALFSSDYQRARSENQFLRNILIADLQEKLAQKDSHLYTLSIVDIFITEYLAGTIDQLPQVAWEYVEFLTEDSERIANLKSNEALLGVYIHIVRLLYASNDSNKEKALSLYQTFKDEIKPSTPMRKYLLQQTDHAFGFADNRAFLNNKDNICISPAHGIFKNFPGYYADEIKLNQNLDNPVLTKGIE